MIFNLFQTLILMMLALLMESKLRFVALLLVIGSIPLFAGLAIVMPILGHATWHLYRKVVVPEGKADRRPM